MDFLIVFLLAFAVGIPVVGIIDNIIRKKHTP